MYISRTCSIRVAWWMTSDHATRVSVQAHGDTGYFIPTAGLVYKQPTRVSVQARGRIPRVARLTLSGIGASC